MNIIVVVLVGLVVSLAVARAHISDTGQDYSSYFQHNGSSCCNQSDCQPVRYEFSPNGRLIMFPQGRAVEIPRALINPKPFMDGNAHWCGRSLLTAKAMSWWQGQGGLPLKNEIVAVAAFAGE
jgi:hypothetical protein